MANSESQNQSIYAGKDDAAGTGAGTNIATYLANAGDVSGSYGTLTVVSGTARQVSTKRPAQLLCNITTAAALTVAMGPTSACTVPVSINQSSALGVISFEVPAGWYVKFTGTVTNYVITYVLK